MAGARGQKQLRAPTAPVFPAAARLPLVGLGTWTQRRPGEVRDAVEAAVRLGYRHLDCAGDYANEGEVGEALATVLADGSVRREELWVTSKLQNKDHAAERVEAACRESLDKLGLDYLDLYLVHWAVTGNSGPRLEPPLEVGGRAVGVSNFSIKKLEQVMQRATIRPAVEAHPYFRNQALIDWCHERSIHVTAYSPLGSPHTSAFFKRREDTPDATLLEIAERHGRSPADVLVSWAVQRGTSCLPKSTKEAHLRSNLDAASWRLPDQDFSALSSLGPQYRMLDGAWFCSPEGPYRTLEELWDTEYEERTSTV
ncbi:hypothetical protein CHLNCDRAFT_138982 [Chlorella variabilis]|uniref:NADP-dependent oxidoreductase domain-containing protein n=1 Tax=Chlorella variabilis TaxID=554065 RepID=E1ZP30_CHLVA|nr:hypothetical protein CHLNCDRAFT_138982 [Chlorella variabilis]EFN52545.1 hypothetical protein CHLNCDRAFT_138982 [Chlorella variabilis]|eukprot:XP_005844647.1 hypothetical protein CHLNCDRAFT_138982 [Chlorella variabilis]